MVNYTGTYLQPKNIQEKNSLTGNQILLKRVTQTRIKQSNASFNKNHWIYIILVLYQINSKKPVYFERTPLNQCIRRKPLFLIVNNTIDICISDWELTSANHKAGSPIVLLLIKVTWPNKWLTLYIKEKQTLLPSVFDKAATRLRKLRPTISVPYTCHFSKQFPYF